MTERERLIELIRTGMNKHEATIENYVKPTADYLADYLLANGVIVPPCKVGDVVYSIQGFNGKPEQCEQYEVTDITIYENTITIHITDEWLFVRNMYPDDFGKTVFLIEEEAEKALKGGDSQ